MKETPAALVLAAITTDTFLCSIPGHFQAGQYGTLVVRKAESS